MSDRSEITLTIHGLDTHNQDVDGEVFAKKFSAFLKALAAADIAANGKRRHKFMVSALAKNTATAAVRERIAVHGPVPGSSVAYCADGITAIYEDRPSARRLPKDFLKPIAALNSGVGETFAFGELKFDAGTVVRIDDFLRRRAEAILEEVERAESRQERLFKGMAFGSFDGVLKLVDLRGDTKRAKLTLSAGGREIDCNVDEVEVEKLRSALDHRAMVLGMAHYNGESGLPVRLDVRDVMLAKPEPDLSRWRGAFSISAGDDDESWGDL
ncbi:hypothetical protein ABB55_16455 [Prosthecomicrobium hirschii]|uniref:Uncharacterized protein n=1 Tax=Prosthecodimorpha hirschii TaxID=665126 RepID=A0A0P6W5C0_9HYPH|nr:hypothetical protein [Prosthecomicrobium hirschii]KPL53608.1 hypothetical protein ABB55_16455 [Prosthecomicrobium hirschii]